MNLIATLLSFFSFSVDALQRRSFCEPINPPPSPYHGYNSFLRYAPYMGLSEAFGSKSLICRSDFHIPEDFRITRSKPLLWVHIHKVSGTLMCLMQHFMGERMATPSANCNLLGHDTYLQSGNHTGSLTCEARLALFNRGNFSYAQIERELWESDICPDSFVYGTFLREPLDLIISRLRYDIAFGYTNQSAAAILSEFKDIMAGNLSIDSVNNQFAYSKLFDNFQTRVLADAFDVPVGRISYQHYQKAQDRLAKFTIVARMGDIGDAAKREQIFAKIGWYPAATVPMVNDLNQTGDLFEASDVAFLSQVNRFDHVLYNSANFL